MKKLSLPFILLTWLLATFESTAKPPPNIVFILSDDQAWTDYGFMGHPEIKTPHLDELARQSLVFERGYVAAPLCRPSLASMLTGLYPFQHGITGNDVDGRNRRAELDVPVRKQFYTHQNFVRFLKNNGYLAHQSGKWWEGSWQDGGFTHGMTHGDPARGGRHGDEGLTIGRKSMKPVKEFIDLAIEKQRPFLTWYAPFLPHTPHNPPAQLLKKYIVPGRSMDEAKYYAMCEWFDSTCGELLDYLNKKEIRENTLVIYICDNGWAAASTNKDDPAQKLWKGYAQRSKSSPFEKGIRTPIMLSWPERIKNGRTQDLAHAIDLFPTIVAAAELKLTVKLPGINLLDRQARAKRKRVFGVCHSVYNMSPGNPDGTLQYLWCVENDWKLLLRYSGLDTTRYKQLHIWDKEPTRLYNLKSDPHEKNELSAMHPEIVNRLRKGIHEWHLAP
jgi:arylsulfatase A-like enzyme